MDKLNWRNLAFWSPITLFVVLLLFVPRGCTSTIEEGRISPTGTPSINITAEKSISPTGSRLEKELRERYSSDLFSERYVKQDKFFFVDHKYEIEADLSAADLSAADLSTLLEGEPILVSVTLPGEIVSTNADNKEGGMANWALVLGKDYKMKATSRYIRWWLIVILALSLVIPLSMRFIFRQKG